MNDFDIPIFKKVYDLYVLFHGYRAGVPKQDRYTIFERCETIMLDVLEGILHASAVRKPEKVPILEQTSVKLNMLRVFIRLMKDVRTIDNKKYIALETLVDEIGRMLGGWIRAMKNE